jgi:hypothetical protein
MLLNGLPIANIKRAVITTEETTPVVYSFETASVAEVEPDISEGEESILRVKNTILATNKTEDIVIGYSITITDNVFNPELFALVDGGVVTYQTPEDETSGFDSYSAPVAGVLVNRQLFTLDVYSENKDQSGETIGYIKFSFKHCKGKPLSYSITDGEFQVPEMAIQSRPANGESPATYAAVTELPEIV